MPGQLFSYVVDHDHGYAPNPEGGLCSLVHCKFRHTGDRRNNLVEMASVGDWILGTGGASRLSAGRDRIIYLMRVDEKIPFQQYIASPEYRGRYDCRDFGQGNQFALLSRHFYYFGCNAVGIDQLPPSINRGTLQKRGMGYRRDMPALQIQRLTAWFGRTYKLGIHGQPCASRSNPALVSIVKTRHKCRPITHCRTEEGTNNNTARRRC
uniref:Nmad2 family putative nucleotide modification protein n=1 Tax=Pigmentiphaga sp. CHJ604 TaxID=3081984 RepID=UPI00403F7B09